MGDEMNSGGNMKRGIRPGARLLAICGAFLIGTILAGADAATAQRLPDAVAPVSYDMKFTPDLPTATFAGEETIHVTLLQDADHIVLNAAELKIPMAEVTAGGSTQTATVTYDPAKEQATLTLPKAVPAGPADLHMTFTGTLNNELRGFYLSQTKRRRYAVTQFEPTDARRAFPSFDEPAYKAVFNVTLVIDKDDTAISNGRIASDTPGPVDGKHTLAFTASPKMSSYLVAMMVGDFQCISGSEDAIPVRVCATPENKNLLDYALETAEANLKFYNRYYAIKYPYGKLDIIAFPDFAAGAMENTAAITYREVLLLLDPHNSSVGAKQNVVSVLAHEMAHQWFGDLVTMAWWNDIWLNEGFATWMAWKPMEANHPEWHAELSEIQDTDGALGVDAVSAVRPIHADVANTPAEINALFDGVAYNKAGSVLRMIEAYVGPETFRKGANAYLEAHKYGNATSADFWNAITAASGKPVDKIMPTFINQPGAPLISVENKCEGGHPAVTLSQQRYFSERDKFDTGSAQLWQVPVLLKDSSGTETSVLLASQKQTFTLPGACSPWIFANAGGRGYYRTSYDAQTQQELTSVAATKLTAEERIRFLGDTWAGVHVGRATIADYLNLLTALKGERNSVVLSQMFRNFQFVHDRLTTDADRAAFEEWTRNLIDPMLNDIGWTAKPGDSDDIRQTRNLLLTTGATSGKDPKAILLARQEVNSYMKDSQSVDPTVVGGAFQIAAQNGDPALYDSFLAHLKTAKTPEEYYNYFGALIAFKQPDLEQRTLDMMLTPAVRGQDLFLFGGAFGDPETEGMAWTFVKMHYDDIVKKLGSEMAAGGIAGGVSGAFCDAAMRDDAQQFFATKTIPDKERQLSEGRERSTICIQTRDAQQASLAAFLQGGGAASAASSVQ
jgi:aminopeptidase N/puromycin-sensitive aminopeptidase